MNSFNPEIPDDILDEARIPPSEPVAEEHELSAAENAELLRQWAARGPQGPIDEEEDLPGDP